MLGDTRHDVQAAHRAGVGCAFLRLGGTPDPGGADRIFDDLMAARALVLMAARALVQDP